MVRALIKFILPFNCRSRLSIFFDLIRLEKIYISILAGLFRQIRLENIRKYRTATGSNPVAPTILKIIDSTVLWAVEFLFLAIKLANIIL
jgi:hypothetical protein